MISTVLLKNKPSKVDYRTYIKITIDINRDIVVIGGNIIPMQRNCYLITVQNKKTFGGGLNLEIGTFETNAIINLRFERNDSTDILGPETRKKFLEIAKNTRNKYV